MAEDTMWWARTTVGWHPAETQDQLIVLPESDAREALSWWRLINCKTWTQVQEVAPELEHELRELADGLEWDEDQFDFRSLPSFEDGDLPTPPWLTMGERLPKALIAAFAITEDTVLSGPFAQFPGDQVGAVLAWLADHGFTAEEHPELGHVLQDPGAGDG
jgi:hypothetical protein